MTCTGLAYLALLLPSSLATADDFDRGVRAMQQRDYDQAIAAFSACIRANPTQSAAYNNRANAYCGKQEYDKAMADYAEAIAAARRRLGEDQAGEGRFDAAWQHGRTLTLDKAVAEALAECQA